MIPFIDKVAHVHDMRELVVLLESQEGVTKDNVMIQCDGILYFQVDDPVKASYEIEDFIQAITNLAQTALRSEIGKLTLDECNEVRTEINDNLYA